MSGRPSPTSGSELGHTTYHVCIGVIGLPTGIKSEQIHDIHTALYWGNSFKSIAKLFLGVGVEPLLKLDWCNLLQCKYQGYVAYFGVVICSRKIGYYPYPTTKWRDGALAPIACSSSG